MLEFCIEIALHTDRFSSVRRKCSWGCSFSGMWWSFAFSMRCLWRHNMTSFSCFQTNVWTEFVDTICIFVYTHTLSLYFTDTQTISAPG